MTASPRIVHLIPHDGIGGVETAARIMAAGEIACDFQLVLIAGHREAGAVGPIIESPWRSALNPLAQLRALFVCLRLAPDVLICSLWRSIPVAVLARLLRPRMRLVLFLNLERPAHPVDAVMSWIGMRAADAIWADSHATLRARLQGQNRPSRVISFVTEALQPLAEAPSGPQPHFVTWSRLNHQKGIDRGLRLISNLRIRGVDATFDVYGPDDGEGARLKALAQQLGIADSVRFPGAVTDRHRLPVIAAEASFFLQLSRFEGMAMATVEAMQLGLVPVVTPVGEMPTYVADGESGLILDADALDKAAERIIGLLADGKRYRSMRDIATAHWAGRPLYADDVCAAAMELAANGREQGSKAGVGTVGSSAGPVQEP